MSYRSMIGFLAGLPSLVKSVTDPIERLREDRAAFGREIVLALMLLVYALIGTAIMIVVTINGFAPESAKVAVAIAFGVVWLAYGGLWTVRLVLPRADDKHVSAWLRRKLDFVDVIWLFVTVGLLAALWSPHAAVAP